MAMTPARIRTLQRMVGGGEYNCNQLGTSYTTMRWLEDQSYVKRVKRAEFRALRSPGRNAFFQLTKSGADAIVSIQSESTE